MDSSGYLLILDVVLQEINILLINVYGPNLNTPDFYSNLQLNLKNYMMTNILYLEVISTL